MKTSLCFFSLCYTTNSNHDFGGDEYLIKFVIAAKNMQKDTFLCAFTLRQFSHSKDGGITG